MAKDGSEVTLSEIEDILQRAKNIGEYIKETQEGNYATSCDEFRVLHNRLDELRHFKNLLVRLFDELDN